MKVHGVSFLAVWLSKLAIAEAISVTLCLVAAVPLKSFAGVDCHLGALAASAALMCFVLFSICMAFAVPARASAPTPSAASARALLGCVGVLLFALFAGGGFYPVYLMDASVRLFNPAWLAHILSDWILGGNGAGAAGTVTLSLLPPAACIAYSLHRARGVLK
jgi:hypothetical protein